MSVIYGRPIVLSSGGGGAGYVLSDTAPEDTEVIWIHSQTRVLYVYDGEKWVPMTGVYGGTGS